MTWPLHIDTITSATQTLTKPRTNTTTTIGITATSPRRLAGAAVFTIFTTLKSTNTTVCKLPTARFFFHT